MSSTVHVSTVVLQFWEALYEDEASKDFLLVGSNGSVKCHSCILGATSEVFKQMVSAPMKEGQTKKIVLKDYSTEELSFILGLVYTGQWTAPPAEKVGEPSLDMLISTCAFAKTYQLNSLCSWMISKISARIDHKTFLKVLTRAIEHDIGALRLAVAMWASKIPRVDKPNRGYVMEVLAKGGLAPELDFELRAMFPDAALPESKKRKML
eukprot:TRINITY_DN112997_c0_g1_i1.p1 TRINITY_DN112997_c0_g1~~TRINITY_DN112997_c0_g1_i1.p1  ORF type:complete len:209 (-),score=33.62 TRINITY_DN112997_c0_g1_i1:198-824(-)